jgi:hypothetical protein
MPTSRKLTHALVALFALVMMSMAALAAEPTPVSLPSEPNDMSTGSILVYNFYTSGTPSNPSENTRIKITNTSQVDDVVVHFFFVQNNCNVADFKMELTANGTAKFDVNEFDPGVRGYIIAIAENEAGVPINWNFLIGDLSFKFPSPVAGAPWHGELGAVALKALFGATGSAVPGATGVTANVIFNGLNNGYTQLPSAVAADSIPSPANGNSTFLVLNSLQGNLATGIDPLPTLFILLYNEDEQPFSTSITGACQRMVLLNNTNIRVPTTFTNVIPSGRTGWMRIFQTTATTRGILGAQLNLNPALTTDLAAFTGSHNLHTLALDATETLVVPIFPSGN